MIDDSESKRSEEELARQIEQLENQDWLKNVRALQPQLDQQELVRVAFAAGQFSAISQRYLVARTIVGSSLLSIAATVIVMLQFFPSVVRSTAERVDLTQQPSRLPSVTDGLHSNGMVLQVSESPDATIELELDKLLAKRLGDSPTPVRSGALNVSNVGSSSVASGASTIETDRLRYVTQRRDWLSEFNTEMPN